MMYVSGSELQQIQRKLKLDPTGKFDPLTEAAVKNFQIKHNIPATGKITKMTVDVMFDDVDLSTDLMDRYNSFIEDYYLPYGEYVNGPTNKEYIFLHHTAGWNNPYRVVDMWASDTRGRIGTQYIIGGINPRTEDTSFDGVVLKCFDNENYAWHLGAVDRYMHKHSIGIELCNFGYLTKRGNKYYTYANTIVQRSQVVDLGYNFRGYRYWQRYSDEQIKKLRALIVHISEQHGISIYEGLKDRLQYMSPADAFGYYDEAKYGEVKGLLSHTSVRTDKFDVFPQPKLIDMILSL